MIKTLIKRSIIAISLGGSAAAMAAYPVGYEDSYVVTAGSQTYFEVLNNDTGDELQLVESNDWTVKGGRTSLQGADRDQRKRLVTYTAPSNFQGEDEFWYVFQDGDGRKNAAKVKITVKPQDANALYPQNDTVSVQKDQSIRVNVLSNDNVRVSSGITNSLSNDGIIVGFNAWSKEGGQIKQVNLDAKTQQLQYTPKSGFIGTDEFWYTMRTDERTIPHAAKVTVNVTASYPSGAYPVTEADNYGVRTTSRGAVRIAYYPLDNDSGKNLKIVERSGYSLEGGTYSVEADGRVTYGVPSKWIADRIAGGGSPVEELDKIWYVIEDEVGRKNWGVINLTIPANFDPNF